MVHDIAAQLPADVDFILIDQDEPLSVMSHLLEKLYLPISMYIDNCEPGQGCRIVGKSLYQQPDSNETIHNFLWLPFARGYILKVPESGTQGTSLQVTSVLTGYDPNAVLCKISDALGN